MVCQLLIFTLIEITQLAYSDSQELKMITLKLSSEPRCVVFFVHLFLLFCNGGSQTISSRGVT